MNNFPPNLNPRHADVSIPLQSVPKRRLTRRQTEVLEEMTALVGREGFSHLRMADIAAKIGCSLTVLYSIAKSRDELIMTAVLRWHTSVEEHMSTLDHRQHVISYLEQVTEVLSNHAYSMSAQFLEDRNASGWARSIYIQQQKLFVMRLRKLIERGIERGEINPVDPSIAAGTFVTISSAALEDNIYRDEAIGLEDSVKNACAIVLRGLAAPEPGRKK